MSTHDLGEPRIAREHGRPVPGAMQWLNEHWDDYPGEWVAVRDGELLGHAVTLDELERQIGDLRESGAHIARII